MSLLAHSRHRELHRTCPLLGVKRTLTSSKCPLRPKADIADFDWQMHALGVTREHRFLAPMSGFPLDYCYFSLLDDQADLRRLRRNSTLGAPPNAGIDAADLYFRQTVAYPCGSRNSSPCMTVA